MTYVIDIMLCLSGSLGVTNLGAATSSRASPQALITSLVVVAKGDTQLPHELTRALLSDVIGSNRSYFSECENAERHSRFSYLDT